MIKNSYKNKIGIIVQCRTKSSRLKNKLLLKINGYCVIEILLMRLKKIQNANIICAIAKEKNNQNLKKVIKRLLYRKKRRVKRMHRLTKIIMKVLKS